MAFKYENAVCVLVVATLFDCFRPFEGVESDIYIQERKRISQVQGAARAAAAAARQLFSGLRRDVKKLFFLFILF